MSLLIKALEQAAKDRDNAKAGSAPADAAAPPASGNIEPTLEPPPPQRAVSSLDSPSPRPSPTLDTPARPGLSLDAPAPRSTRPSLDATASPLPSAPDAPASRGVLSADAPARAAPSLDAGRVSAPLASAARAPSASAPQRSSPPLDSAGMGRSAIPADTAPRGNASLSLDSAGGARPPDSAGAARRTAQTSASMANIDAQHQRARAATVMQASGRSMSSILTNLRANPVMLFGAIAVLFGVGFGIYVYLQVAQPGLFVRQAAKQPDSTPQPPLAPVATEPSAQQPAPAVADQGTTPPGPSVAGGQPVPPSPANPSVAVPGAAAQSPASPTPIATGPGAAAPTTGAIGAAAAPERGAVATAGAGAPVSAASVIGGPRATEPSREGPLARAADLSPERGSIAARPEARRPSPAPEPAAARPSPAAAESAPPARERIAVTPAAAQPRLNPVLSMAYTSLQAGDLENARSQYSRVVQSEPMNVDALLGLAYIAAQENRSDDAVRFYVRILQVNPRHGAAQGALIGLMGRANPIESETRLKQLIAREPSAFLHFVLGNLYADQSLWAQAQQSYFQAHHLEPDNADYTYNLAVGLDHIGQTKLALNFYRRAEQLAESQGRSNFNVAHARERISSLSSQLE